MDGEREEGCAVAQAAAAAQQQRLDAVRAETAVLLEAVEEPALEAAQREVEALRAELTSLRPPAGGE